MRMFQSVSGYGSEQSIANHSSRPTVLQLKCVYDTIFKLTWESPTTEDKNSTVTNAFFIQNSNQMASRRWPQPQVFRGNFSTPAILKVTSKLFGSQGCSDDNQRLHRATSWYELFVPLSNLRSGDLCKVDTFVRRLHLPAPLLCL